MKSHDPPCQLGKSFCFCVALKLGDSYVDLERISTDDVDYLHELIDILIERHISFFVSIKEI